MITNAQIIYLLSETHATKSSERKTKMDELFDTVGVQDNETLLVKSNIWELFENGISRLNGIQLKNLVEKAQKGESPETIVDKLNYYGIDSCFHQNILDYLSGFHQATQIIEVEQLDPYFEGVQVATRDDFEKILSDKYTGDWILNPANINSMRVQVASMNNSGRFPRGWYINADIVRIEEVYWGTQKRYRLHFQNAVAIDSGNRNVKFKQMPVTYIKRGGII